MKTFFGITLSVFLGLLAVALIFLGIYAFRWFYAEPKGQLEAREQIQSGDNRIQKQELFETLFADVEAYDDQINVTAQTLTQSEASGNQKDISFYRQILNGQMNQCIDATQQYNAEARFVSAEQFRSVDLPPEIPSTYVDYDCKVD